MARQPYWKGYLKLSLVTCPVLMAPAVSEQGAVRLKMVNAATGNPVENRYLDSVTGKPVPAAQQVKGYERAENDYVLLEDEDFAAVALESTRTIEISDFIAADAVEWVWYETPHYLLPGDKVGLEAFSVIREAMRSSDVAGVSRLVLQRRERAVLLEPRGKGLVLWTLRYGDEVRPEEGYFAGLPEQAEPSRDIARAVSARETRWSEEWLEDPVREALLDVIAGKKKTRRRAAKQQQPEGNVVDMVEALRRSLRTDL